jgi:hypothetical protein
MDRLPVAEMQRNVALGPGFKERENSIKARHMEYGI